MPSDIEVYDSTHYENLYKVGTLRLKGENPTAIAKETGLKRKDVLALIEEWRHTTIADEASRDVAREALNSMVNHYDLLIKEAWKTLEDTKKHIADNGYSHQLGSTVLSASKVIAEMEAKRVDALQKAGILDASDMGDEVARLEEEKRIVVDILQNDLCRNCKKVVGAKLSSVTGSPEVVVVYE